MDVCRERERRGVSGERLDAVQSLEQGKRLVHQNGPAFLCLSVEAGRKKTMYLAWSVYAQAGSNGATATSYYYNRYFSSARQAADYILGHREELLLASRKSEEEIGGKYPDPGRFLLFCQAVRAYYACCQLLRDEGGAVRYNICEGAYLWRNTMDLCADHLVWELARNPWVVRNIMINSLRSIPTRIGCGFREGRDCMKGESVSPMTWDAISPIPAAGRAPMRGAMIPEMDFIFI